MTTDRTTALLDETWDHRWMIRDDCRAVIEAYRDEATAPLLARIEQLEAVVEAARRYREAEDQFIQTFALADGAAADAAMNALRKSLDVLAALDRRMRAEHGGWMRHPDMTDREWELWVATEAGSGE